MAKRVIILAGNRREFEQWLADNGKTDSEATFGYEPRVLHGIEASDVLTIGTFWRRKDADQLLELAKTRVDKGELE